jgi:hypothetical protein
MTTQEQIEVLKKAKQKITGHFTTGVCARDKNGLQVEANSKEAVCFCALGAISSVLNITNFPYDFIHLIGEAHSYFSSSSSYEFITKLNDTEGERAVLNMFDGTIRFLKKKVSE